MRLHKITKAFGMLSGFAVMHPVWALAQQPAVLAEAAVARWAPPPTVTSLLLQWAPLGAVLVVAFMMHYRLKRIETMQREEFEQIQRKETMLLMRERYVLVSTLESELLENKNRIDAFLTIYGDMLRSLKNTNEVPQYQKAGDIVQKHPLLSRTVFEANIGKLSLLDMQLAGQISKLYAALPKEQEYINIEPNVPLDTATKLVEKILKEAADMLPQIDQAVKALNNIVAQKEA